MTRVCVWFAAAAVQELLGKRAAASEVSADLPYLLDISFTDFHVDDDGVDLSPEEVFDAAQLGLQQAVPALVTSSKHRLSELLSVLRCTAGGQLTLVATASMFSLVMHSKVACFSL